jgi:signal transduction histidine kinase
MGALRSRRFRQPRLALLGVLLVLSVVVAALLAHQAYISGRLYKATAERALTNYAAIAAADYAFKAREKLYYVLIEAFYPLERERPTDTFLPSPSIIEPSASKSSKCETPEADSARYYFRVDLRNGAVVTTGAPTTPDLRRWIGDTITSHVGGVYRNAWWYALISGEHDGRHHMLAYVVIRPDTMKPALAAYGFQTCMATWGAPIFRTVTEAPMLPPAVMGTISNDSMFAVLVTDSVGRELFRSPLRHPDTYSASSSLGVRYAGITARVAISPVAGSRLVAGGLPKNRDPFLIALFILTASFVGIALIQVRKEYELARLRTDFISSVSHELRTPLAQIRMFAETLLLGRVRSETERRRSLEIIDQEARRLTHLVGNVLEFSRAERRVSQVTLEPTDVAAELRETLECFAPIAAARRTELRSDLQDGIIAPVDRGALRQVILNLLDNAVKYGPPGQAVTVGSRLSGQQVRISVQDEGAGIGLGEQARIWEPFYRLERETEGAIAGSGIGLAVVRDLVELHGGRAWLDASVRRGARFVVDLPGAELAGDAGATRPVAAGPSNQPLMP